MRIILVRHAQPEYEICKKRGFIGLGINLAPLSEEGCMEAEAMSKNPIFKDSQLIVSSPYTRALQTAAIISKAQQIPIAVEIDLQEWIPDLSYMDSFEDEKRLSDEFKKNAGHHSSLDQTWEPIDRFSGRIINSLNKYLGYSKIIVVCHAAVMYHLTGMSPIPYCGIIDIDYNDKYKPQGLFL